MKIQVLVAAMNQTDHSLIEKMNIKTDAIVGNQCNFNSVEKFNIGNQQILYLNFAEKGVGLNRNNALMRADGDICLFADDDVVYKDDYAAIIKRAFEELPDADAIIFNINTVGTDVGRRENKKIKRVRYYNALNYNTPRIAARCTSIRKNNISFHSCFGGGTIYNAGEDTLFIIDMLKNGLKLYTYPVSIGLEYQTESTWFRGYNKKYLHDKGALFFAISSFFFDALCIQDLIRHKYIYRSQSLTFWQAYKIMKLGKKSFKTLRKFDEVNVS